MRSLKQSILERFLRSLARKVPDALRNAPLFLFATAGALAVEVIAAGGIFQEDQAVVPIGPFHVRIAYAKAVMSASMTILSVILAGAAACQKADPREKQQKRAGWTQTLAVLALSAPVFFAGSYLAISADRAAYQQFHNSEARRADIAIVSDPQADSMVKQNAAQDLQDHDLYPTAPSLGGMVGACIGIGATLGLNMLMVRAGWRARPIKKQRRRKARRSNVVAFKAA